MKHTKVTKILLALFAVVLCFGPVGLAGPVGTAFTYQGRLIDNNQPADGLYDLKFKLYDSNAGGAKVGSDINKPEVDAIDGYFTVELDFNDINAFNGSARWLEIGVRPGEQNDPNVYTALIPRQKITPTPYAIYALGGGGGGADSDWIISGNNMYSGVSGNVGIGTTSPAAKLSVNGDINAASVYKIAGNTVLSVPGTENTFVGVGAGPSNTGSYNTFTGNYAGNSNTTGSSNTFTGDSAGFSNTTGGGNSAVGDSALVSNTTGGSNLAVGSYALQSNTTGSSNIAVGGSSLASNTTGNNNIAVGTSALSFYTTGSRNSALGVVAGGDLSVPGTGNGNVFLGYKAGYNEGGSNKLYIANSDVNTLIYGDFSNKYVGINTTTPARNLHINDVMRLQPRSAAPSSPAEGDIYYSSSSHKLMVYDGTTWQACWE
jgi:hypothetical protein